MSATTLAARRRVRVCYFNTWAGPLEDARAYVARVPSLDLAPLVSDRHDAALMRKARLDCDWYAENARCFAAMQHAGIEFLPAWVVGRSHLLDVAQAAREPGEERWMIWMAHQPQSLGALAGKSFELLARVGVRQAFYAFDEASRCMPCCNEIAPYLDVLVHDEEPLADAGLARLKPSCRTLHHSWVANLLPRATAFCATPEEKIVFLGSQLGLTPHRQRQIDFLQQKFQDRFTAISDHSLAVGERHRLAERFKVSVCPEGRKFTTPAMASGHTDRPFWSGCLGLVPVSEDARTGGRLEDLHRASLILRYPHGDLKSLAAQCERALALPNDERRKIYEHFNAHETIGTVLAREIAGATAPH